MSDQDIHQWVRDLQSRPVERFYPSAAAKATGVPLPEAFRQLLGLVNVGCLRLAYEVRCPQCGQVLDVQEVPAPTSLYEQTFSCEICGQDIEVTADNTFPVFFVKECRLEEHTECST